MKRYILILLLYPLFANAQNEKSISVCDKKNQFVSYHENGNIYFKGCKINGEQTGVWEEYYINSNLKEKGIYTIDSIGSTQRNCIKYWQSLKIGIWEEYHENGKMKTIGKYIPRARCYQDTLIKDSDITITMNIEYYKDGMWQYFDESGDLQKEEKYSDGKLIEK